MAILSVPPSVGVSRCHWNVLIRILTGKRGSDKDRGETTDSAHERGTWDVPVFTSDVSSLGISTTVDDDAHNNEDLGMLVTMAR